MKRTQVILYRVLHPPKWILCTLPPIVFAVLTYVLSLGKNGIPEYLVYVMSAYCFVIWALPMPKLFRKVRTYTVRHLNGTAFGRRFLGEFAFRGRISLYSGMTANFLYMVLRIFAGIRYASVWDITIAIYYLLLGLIRLSLILSDRSRTVRSELRCYRRTAALLFALNIPMGGMILLMVLTNSGYSYPGYIIYLSALYTFYMVIFSVVNIVKSRKLGSPILSAAKVLNFVSALMSVLGLQTAMIAQFSEYEDSYRRRMNAITGGFVYGAVILIAVYMLFHSRKMKEVKSLEPLGE